MIRGYLTSLGIPTGMGLFRRGNIIIKAQHNCVSDRRTYGGRFIPIVHEYVLLLRKETPLVIPFLMTYRVNSDIRDMPGRHMAGISLPTYWKIAMAAHRWKRFTGVWKDISGAEPAVVEGKGAADPADQSPNLRKGRSWHMVV